MTAVPPPPVMIVPFQLHTLVSKRWQLLDIPTEILDIAANTHCISRPNHISVSLCVVSVCVCGLHVVLSMVIKAVYRETAYIKPLASPKNYIYYMSTHTHIYIVLYCIISYT